jgi:N-acetylglucosaminyldiphosphoundecaprenol N-acetyl-beta-D-mannosaminyltransferase
MDSIDANRSERSELPGQIHTYREVFVHINYAGLTMSGLTKRDLFDRLEQGRFFQVVTVNAEFIVESQTNERLKGIINRSFSTFDGEIPFRRAKKQYPGIDIEKISGSDVCYDFFHFARKKNKRVFILGGSESSNELCCENIRNKYGVEAHGFSPPLEPYPFSDANTQEMRRCLKKAQPHILLVCFGAVKQEFWIDDNKEFLADIGCNLVIGAGGTVDFLSGKVARAPVWIQQVGLEGVYRLVREPNLFRLRRLFKSLRIYFIEGA